VILVKGIAAAVAVPRDLRRRFTGKPFALSRTKLID